MIQLSHFFGVFVEAGPHLLGLGGDLQVDTIEQKLEISYIFLIIFEDFTVANHSLYHFLVDTALKQRIDIGILQ